MQPLKKILHIDDDAVMRMMIKKSLDRSERGFEVINCATMTEFMDQLADFAPDLLVIDVIMPNIDGPTLLQKVRNLNNNTPAIFMTGQESLDLVSHINLEPILGIIHKPFSPTLLADDLMKLWDQYNHKQ